MATAKLAKAKGLCVVTGTQRHHERPYVEAFKKITRVIIGVHQEESGSSKSGGMFISRGKIMKRIRAGL